MLNFFWLVLVAPFAGFFILTFLNKNLSKTAAAVIGAGSVGLSALVSIISGLSYITGAQSGAYIAKFWTWFDVAGFQPGISIHLDALSLIFVFVITFVGFLIHLYSIEFMWHDEGFSRFFAYMNLFVGSMLILVLADNLLLLYLGWEGVGLCSFLLIGFWYKEAANAMAAKKAFIVTRIGDTAMAIGLFLLFKNFNTLNITELLSQIPVQWAAGSPEVTLAALLLLGGALGKSAQLPLQTWLPDAMAGPSPVSALIHAATMVTAGVYLIARMHVLFALSPIAMTTIAIIGAVTLLIAGFSALVQYDIKKVLAYSTISQIGYMFLALGVGAWSAAVFHFMIHAFFKALLFLGAGAVILALHHEHNMFKMGGLRKKLPVTFWTFLIGSASLAALPLITAGFYSKDMILWYALASEKGSGWLWGAGIAGALLTAIYTFRMVFLTFYGTGKTEVSAKPGNLIKIPLIVLAVLSVIGGFIELPHTMGNFTPFSHFLTSTLPGVQLRIENVSTEIVLQVVSGLLALLGIYLAYLFFIQKPALAKKMDDSYQGLKRFWLHGWEFDKLYDLLFVKPFIKLSTINKNDFIDRMYNGTASFSRFLHYQLKYTQSGNLRWYVMGLALGAILTLTLILFL